MSEGRIPPHCPSCGSVMMVVRLECPVCATEVNGDYELCPTCRLEDEPRRILELFLDSRGNLKEVQRRMGVSYPTVRARVEEMFAELDRAEPRPEPGLILDKVRSGELDVDAAVRLLSGEEKEHGDQSSAE